MNVMAHRLFTSLLWVFLALLQGHAMATQTPPHCLGDLLQTVTSARPKNKRQTRVLAEIIHFKNNRFYESLDEKLGIDPKSRIEAFLGKMERLHAKARTDTKLREALRAHYHERYVIKHEQVPEKYFEAQARLALNQGQGEIVYTPALKKKMTNILIKDQKKSIDSWFDYLLSADDKSSFAAKYWGFTSMAELKPFNAANGTFSKRTRDTVPFFRN